MRTNRILTWGLSMLLAFTLSHGLQAQDTQEFAKPKVPLEQLLNRDGGIDLNQGFQGSLDPAGWQMEIGTDGQPRFVPANAQPQTVNGAQIMAVPGDENWDAQFSPNGVNNRVMDLAFDGSGNLYAGGFFTSAGGAAANRIAKWDGIKWSALGSGVQGASNVYVYSLAYDQNGSIYAGGQFTTAGGTIVKNIAKWDLATETWSAVGDLNTSYVTDLTVGSSGDLFVGAQSGYPGYVHKWDGSGWSALGSGFNSGAYTVALDGNGNVYAGGSFNAHGPSAVNKVAKWDGITWSDLGSGTSTVGGVTSLAVDGNGNLYVGGWFAPPPYGLASQVAKWDGSSWTRLGTPMDGSWGSTTVNAVAVDRNGNVYAGGSFSTAGGVNANRVAKWDRTTGTWSALGAGMNSDVWTLTIDENGDLYAGGDFTLAGAAAANYIAKWDGTSWSALGGGNGMNGLLQALAVDGSGNLYAGGNFTGAGSSSANRIAKWNGENWSALGSGVDHNSTMQALVADGSGNLYAGGYFTAVDGTQARHIAKWDGTRWSALGGGMNGAVRALVIDGNGRLYAAGNFTDASGMPANYVATWDGTAWAPLGSGMNSFVFALAVDGGGNLYAGGNFTTAGGKIANYIAKWDGTSWSALGNGMNSYVYALAFDKKGILYAAGPFTSAGTASTGRIAKWDGTSWSALGSGVEANITALTVDGSGNLYVGGSFTAAGGVSANRIARWDGANWSGLGSGVNNVVYALAASGSDLYTGGAFTAAGDKPSFYIGRYTLNAPPTAASGGPYSVDEGSSVLVTASGYDPENGPLAYAWDLDNDGSFESPGQGVSLSAAGFDGPSTHTIKVQVTDNGGLTATDQAIVNVLNVAPTASFANLSGTIIAGQSATLAFSDQADPSASDVSAGFLYSYDCTNDGTFEISDVAATASYACPYPAGGTFTAKGRIKDKNGDFRDYTVEVIVETPQDAVRDLIDQVLALNKPQGNGLIGKLNVVIKRLDKNEIDKAIEMLQQFIDQVNVFMHNGTFTAAEGQPLIDAANAIIAALRNPALAAAGSFKKGDSEGFAASASGLPTEFLLAQNSPNPFNPTTTIQFSVPRESHVRLKVYNSSGAEVATLVDRQVAAGTHNINWNASHLASGIYMYRLEAEGFAQTRRLLLMK